MRKVEISRTEGGVWTARTVGSLGESDVFAMSKNRSVVERHAMRKADRLPGLVF